MLFSLFLLLLFVQPSVAVTQVDTNTPVRVTDLKELKQLGSVSLSPDGSLAIYSVQSITGEDNKLTYNSQLWLVPADGSSQPRQLTFGEHSASNPSWHPSGNKIAFTRSVDGKSQIFVLPLTGGESIQYTSEKHGASQPRWSPDGRQLLYSVTWSHLNLLAEDAYRSGPLWPQEKPMRNPFDISDSVQPNPDGTIEEIRAWLDQNERDHSPKILNRLNFQGEFFLIPQRSYTHWYVMPDQAGAEARALTSGFFSFTQAAWMPDSRTVLLEGNSQIDTHPDRVRDSGIYRVSVSGGAPERFIFKEGFSLGNPTPSPDGRHIAFRYFDNDERGYFQSHIGLLEVATGNMRVFGEALDRALGNVQWSPDSRFVYAVAPADGGFPLYRFRVSNGNMERLSPFETGIRDYAVHSNTIVFVQTSIENPFELYTADASLNRARRISDHNHHWVSQRAISRPQMHTVTTDDGIEVQYWVMKPHGYTEGMSYPTVLQIHGGPSAMWGPGEASMWHEFQLFTAHGFGVVYSNPRGSGGYGFDFQKANHQDWGFGPMKDVLTALEDASERNSWIDQERLTVTGGSYGGYLVAFVIGNDHRFVAAAAQRGVYELETFLGEGNAWALVPDRFGGFPWEDGMAELLRRESPQTYAHLIETPLLILHADNDLRTGVSQSEMMYRTLKILERDVEYVRYPDAGHDLSRTGNPWHRMDRLLRMIEFMKRYTD